MIDNSLVADIYENEQPNAEIEEDEVEIEVPDFVSIGLGGGEDGFSPIVSLSKTGRVTTLEITDKNGKQTTKIYDGDDGHRGTGILNVTTAPQNYIFAVGGKFPKKRMLLSTICAESGVNNVLVGDIIAYESEHCHVYYIDSTYAYMDTVVSVRGADGTDGADGKDGAQWYFTQAYEAVLQYGNDGDLSVDLASPNLPVYKVDKANNQMVFTGAYLKGDKGDPYTLTDADKAEMVAEVISALPVYGGEVESV